MSNNLEDTQCCHSIVFGDNRKESAYQKVNIIAQLDSAISNKCNAASRFQIKEKLVILQMMKVEESCHGYHIQRNLIPSKFIWAANGNSALSTL